MQQHSITLIAASSGILQDSLILAELNRILDCEIASASTINGHDNGHLTNIVDRCIELPPFSWVIHDADYASLPIRNWHLLGRRFSSTNANKVVREFANFGWTISLVAPCRSIPIEGYLLFVTASPPLAEKMVTFLEPLQSGFIVGDAIFKVARITERKDWEFESIAVSETDSASELWDKIWRFIRDLGEPRLVAPSNASDYIDLFNDGLRNSPLHIEKVNEVGRIPRSGVSVYRLDSNLELCFFRWCARVWEDPRIFLCPRAQIGNVNNELLRQLGECWEHRNTARTLDWILDLGSLSENAHFTSRNLGHVSAFLNLCDGAVTSAL